MWSMVVTRPGPTLLPTKGRADTRSQASRCAVAAYERLLARDRLGVDDNHLAGLGVEDHHQRSLPQGSDG
jgi:hypothetical protein